MIKQGFSTRVIHTDYQKKDAHNALQMPIYSNAAFAFETAEQMEAAFMGRSADHSYSRISNPTVENFENRIKSITGAQSVTALSSGMAAISNLIFTIAKSGDNIVTSSHLFGNTYSFFKSTIEAFGLEVRFCDLTNTEEIIKHSDKRTIAIFFETITNPQLEVINIIDLSTFARSAGILLIADSTLTPPNIFSASKFGVDIEVISSTKIISGGATSIGGLIIDYGSYNWDKNEKLKDYSKRFGPFAFYAKLRKEVFRNLGACLSPYAAYLQSLGLETMSLRYDAAAKNTLAVINYLQTESTVKQVNYPGLRSSAYHEIAKQQFGEFPGTILTFNLASKEACFQFMNRLKLICRSTNICDNRTLILHPASTIYCDFNSEIRENIGVPDTLIRFSPGIESPEDLISDLQQALN